ncbi:MULTISPECIES: 4-demethylwyosine synthase TYW1 [Halobacterium]|uniref:S-adenosyl-L-methionine-dependent tRNA 4-demethylwyosine synthase n=1 Tax=Halobacterium salinarum (strain ATCC 33171 / DSM 3754 / JCM 8978 / NBRC 102687 / NCIMB 764 / 91-R6) TaxID=2597657 RepID=A0A4D6GX97_HALS9|nr:MULTISPECIES: 4-demethylwyosine synthase TYW1 [Halobacterium]MCF2165888.1 4-demethylwyosine synthase TYW1 [Halobacterium salinarum]MCF2167343.1 4-demethylwyosine synthase TYW1 [Halobacterium salinarum]MCF2207378.1 4-demethylwyosine synthase TYW1 [Halobacterium salinarum]MCF2239531.1 4-demethylwyosine synthase TYW1 [Halobacterium salinarum]MCF2239859.1 4-demethylwyosine synthase TYW1 [Halobacterium salinarum]
MSESDGPKQVDDPDYHHENHTAAQTCGWTANAMRGEGTCYKHAFYGIRSHRCIQMTPVVRCNERCVFCWRDHSGHTYELDGVAWDDPEAVVDASIRLQRKLLSGFGGNDEVPRERFEEAMEPRHVAISLDGEPTLYPHLPELIEAFHDRGLTTFLVSNGTRPAVLRECDPTQLYVSVDAPERATFDDVVGATEDDAWERLVDTMDVLHAKDDTRTVLRTTLVGGQNMANPDWYAGFFERAAPDFVELKAYMHVGDSRDRLGRAAMPDHEDVLAFARAVKTHLPHSVLREQPASRVALLARDEDTWVEDLRPESAFWTEGARPTAD